MEFLDKDRFDYECGIARDVVPLLRRLNPEYVEINDLLARSLVIAELLERIDALTKCVGMGTVENCDICVHAPDRNGLLETCDADDNECKSCDADCACRKCVYGERFEVDWEVVKTIGGLTNTVAKEEVNEKAEKHD